MATTRATLSISSNDLQLGNTLSINADSTLMNTGLTTGMEFKEMGNHEIATGTEFSLAEALGTANGANWVYICNTSTDDNQYMVIGIHDTVMGNLGAGEWLWMPWNMGDSDAEINIEAEPSGTIPYEWAIFKSTYTLPASSQA